MPFLKPPAPKDPGSLRASEEKKEKEEVWTLVLKPGEVIDIQYEG